MESNGASIVYIVRGERFAEYIHSAYGRTVKVSERTDDVRLSKVDPYGVSWVNKYGYPKSDGHYDFTCLNPSAAFKGYGKIEKI